MNVLVCNMGIGYESTHKCVVMKCAMCVVYVCEFEDSAFWLYSSVGRALDSKSKGHRFKSGYGHEGIIMPFCAMANYHILHHFLSRLSAHFTHIQTYLHTDGVTLYICRKLWKLQGTQPNHFIINLNATYTYIRTHIHTLKIRPPTNNRYVGTTEWQHICQLRGSTTHHFSHQTSVHIRKTYQAYVFYI